MDPDMKKLKLLAAIAVLGIPFAACEEATPPPPVGSIVGTVSIEGTGIDGVSVNLSNGNSTTTAGGGSYRFDNVEGGAYTVTISGFPSDATFDATSAAATIASAGQSVTVNFTGAYIRTASVMGTVTVENMGLPGVTVMLTGVSSASAVTDDNGQYAFTGLRMGSYSVEISGFDSDEVGFSATAAAVSVGVGESKIVSFDGTYLRTAGIMGRVSVEGEGLEGVTVSLSGGPDATDMTTMTDAAGQYSFAKLRAGDYAVGISGYDTDDYEFEVTSQNVTVALGETASVPFEGVLLRTSGISGRVSVEGMGLEGIPVMLSMGDEAADSAMTDAGGLYAFSGLAAGDYTVSIMVESEAYVFESMSMDVTVGDDMTEIANFEGMHARTASVSGMLFIDELMKNDMYDEGEHPLPHAGVPVVLVGPGVNDQVPSATDSTGAYSFMGLKAGDYQLVVPVTEPMGDFAYGGSATGYSLTVGVGDAVTQNLPIDITHTTVHFGVTLKAGDMRGMPLPGAMVTLYSDAMGENKVGEGMTMVDEETMHAVASIRIAREGTSGNTVHAGVTADSAYTVADGMTAVMWDPQKTYTMGANDNDIVNLNVDVTFSGATITTEYGGGKALGGWAVSVMMGDSAVADAPEMLDTMGVAALMTTVDAVPATFTIAVADNQDNDLDGGEKYEATDLEYTHTGLTLAGTMDAGTIEVQYTTQTLKVYVHHELDQVEGYTGNVLGGDARASGYLDVNIRYIADNGRSRAFAANVWRKTRTTFSDFRGVVTFRGVPADANVIAVANEVVDTTKNIMLLEPDELAAYTDMEANGIMGGAFGDHGGFHHTVELCPLMRVDPTAQDHGECASFAFVETYAVHGQAWKNDVIMNRANDGFTVRGLRSVPGTTVDLDPVAGKNLGGESESFTALTRPIRTAGESSRGTEVLDETKQFNFGRMAAGVYKVTVPTGWVARIGTPDDAAGLASIAFNPLAGDAQVDVTPTTGILYGRVNGGDGFPLDSTTVDVNGMSTETDEFGRYIVDGFGAVRASRFAPTNPTFRNQLVAVVTASRGGFDMRADTMLYAGTVNTPTEHDIDLAGTAETATVSGTVTAFGSDTPIAGVQIRVDGMAPINKNAKSVRTLPANDIYVTGADGSYTISVPAKGVGMTSRISAHRAGMTFSPAHLDLSTPKGSSISGINFQGVANSTIAGRVQAPDPDGDGPQTGGPLSGVMVKAIADGATEATDSMSTGATGTFSLSVPAGTYDVDASKDGYTFTCPGTPASCTVTIGLGQTVSFGDFMSTKDADPPTPASDDATLSALTLSDGTLTPAFSSADTMYTANVGVDTDSITVMATATHDSADVVITPAESMADSARAGDQVELAIGENTIMATVTAEDGSTMRYHLTVTRSDGHQAPSAPTNFEVAPGEQSATLTWGAPRQIGSSAITGYGWQASAPGYVTVGSGNTNLAADATTVNATGLTNGVTYTFSVWAINQKGESGSEVDVPGDTATATAKAQPSINITIDNTTLTEAHDQATDTATVTIALSQPSIETITVTVVEVLFAGTDTARTSQVDIANATVVIPAGSTTPAAGATAPTITATDDEVDEEADGDANSGTALVQATATNAIDSDSDNGTEGQQPNSLTITDDDTVPGQPGTLVFSSVGATGFTVEWTSPSAPGTSDITHYEIRYSAETLDDDDEWMMVSGGAGGRTHAVTGLTTGTTYNVEVRAVSARRRRHCPGGQSSNQLITLQPHRPGRLNGQADGPQDTSPPVRDTGRGVRV